MVFVARITAQVLLLLGAASMSASTPRSKIKREKRSLDDQGAAIPGNVIQPTSLNTAYFLGQCMVCPPGPQGPVGPQGMPGPSGRDGRDALLFGYSGESPPAPPPPVGTPGSPGGSVSTPRGATYTRWGKPGCPGGAMLIYEGSMAGSHYTHVGGASNYLCLSNDPIFDDEHTTAGNQYGAYIYGTEYETGSSPLFPNLQDSEVPCAVCLAPSSSLTLMVPGRNECPNDGREWKLEYKGLLMSQHHSQKRTEFVCVDSEAEGISRTHGNHNGALLYIVEAACANGGGIPCPPYADGFEITCAVCSL